MEQVRRIKSPERRDWTVNTLNLKTNMTMEPYHNQFMPIPIKEEEEQLLLVHPQVGVSKHELPFVTRVKNKQCWIPLANDSSSRKEWKVGTLVGTYELITEDKIHQPVEPGEVNILKEIQNDLVPQVEPIRSEGSRQEKLGQLIDQQQWTYLSKKQREELRAAILAHDELFIVEPGELGLLKGPPAKIAVADSQPIRGPSYRYPEEAKSLIAEMLVDMEDRGIIEKSTSAWLSPIVLVNKSDGSKRMCLDYRQVNTHLCTDIYPLPRLDELVEQAAGQKYYVTLDMREAIFRSCLMKIAGI